jgi:hypothetical protein
MVFMATKDQPPKRRPGRPAKKKRPPSRDKLKYVALPIDLHGWLERFAKSKSTPYDNKSVAWAARQAVYWFKQHVEEEARGAGPEA